MLKRNTLLLALPLFGVLACGTQKVAMTGSPQMPSAQGEVKVKEKDGNRRVQLKVKHLAPAAKIAPNATGYVVWVQPLDAPSAPQNIGALKVNDDLEGELETITPFDKFELFVTPEPSETTLAPTGQKVLSSQVR